ncbi:MAG TPA: SRPBCC family protein [Burkholderiaceae bacterium]|nr:SRPBCC family protein [Burkholderiaceae bacterium]
MKPFFFNPLLARSALLPAQDEQPGSRIDVGVQCVQRDGHALYEIRVSGLARATPQASWQVLTGYQRLQEFVPGLLSSTLLSRSGPEVVLEQEGVAGFLFLQQTIHLVVRVIEQPFSTLDISLISGDMQHYASHWELLPAAQGSATRISYCGSMVPDFYVPPLIGSVIMRADVRQMMAAVIAEIGRRSGA